MQDVVADAAGADVDAEIAAADAGKGTAGALAMLGAEVAGRHAL